MANVGSFNTGIFKLSFLAIGRNTDLSKAERNVFRVADSADAAGGKLSAGWAGRIPAAGIGVSDGGLVGYEMGQRIRQLCEQASGSGMAVSSADDGRSILLTIPSNVKLGMGPYGLGSQFSAMLDKIAQTINAHPNSLIDIYGHTACAGSGELNQVLSERRALTVANYLSDKGVHPARSRCLGFGATMPVADNATPQGRAQNRRVEIKIVPVTQDQILAARRESG